MEINNRKLTALLLDLHKSSRSGILRIERRHEKKQLVLHQGLLVYAESNQPEDHLAKVMVTENLLASSALKEITSGMKQGKNSEEAILALPNAKIEDVMKGRHCQAIAIAASLWAWTELNLHLFAGEDRSQHHSNLALSLPELLILSARRAIAKKIITLPHNYLQGTISPVTDLEHRTAAIPFHATESEILSTVKNPAPMSELFTRFPADSLLCLLTLGLLEYHADTEQSESGSDDAATQIRNLETMVRRLRHENFYQILSVSPQTRPEEIQTAYHDLAKQFHPDRFQSEDFSSDIRRNAQHVFAAINEAYRVLKNPNSRTAYDTNRQTPTEQTASSAVNGASLQSDQEKLAATLFQSGRSFLTQNEYDKAAEYFKRCLWLRPQNALYTYYMGVALAKNPKLQKEAEHHLLKALELDAMSIESHLELAKLYINSRLPRKAEQHLRQFLHWNPHHQEAENLLKELG
jgi:curved DNA-binding protein CbpA